MYYLNSRYYSPEWGRFINADGIAGVQGVLLSHNMFAYCSNNYINLYDPSGYMQEIGYDLGGTTGGGLAAPLSLLYLWMQEAAQGLQTVGNLPATQPLLDIASSGGSSPDPNQLPELVQKAIEVSNKEMHQLGKHFNKHGRDMGYSSKPEYDAAAKAFARSNQSNPSAKIFDATWNGKGALNGTAQRAICWDGKTVILDKVSGQVIDFYKGNTLGGLINIVEVTF